MVTKLQFEMGEAKETITRLEDELWKEKAKTRKLRRHQCDQLTLHEATLEEKDTEIACLRGKLAGLELTSDQRRTNERHTPRGAGEH